MLIRWGFLLLLTVGCLQLSGCITESLRFPSNLNEIGPDSRLVQSLKLAASNQVVFYFPNETLFEANKTEVDFRCRQYQKPFWTQEFKSLLTLLDRHPEWYSKFHVLQFSRGDSPSVHIEKDLDGVKVLNIEYARTQSVQPIKSSSKLPCEASLAEYIGQNLTITKYEFPKENDLEMSLQNESEKPKVNRLNLNTDFLSYLAERGLVLKFSHESSFQKTDFNHYALPQVLDKLANESQKIEGKSYLNSWIKKIKQFDQSSEVQFFSVENSIKEEMGIKSISSQRADQKQFISYLFVNYVLDDQKVKLASLEQLNKCLQKMPYSDLLDSVKEYENRMPSSVADDIVLTCH